VDQLLKHVFKIAYTQIVFDCQAKNSDFVETIIRGSTALNIDMFSAQAVSQDAPFAWARGSSKSNPKSFGFSPMTAAAMMKNT
jgi:hypothetical protein